MIKIVVFLFFFGFVSTLNADTLYLNNGRHIEGIVKNEGSGIVELEVSGGSVKFKKSEVERIERNAEEETLLMRQKWEKKKIELQKKIEKQKTEEENKPKKVAFYKDGQGIVVEAKLNNKVQVSLVLDTGASVMLLRKEVAQKLGINLDNVKPDSSIIVADGRKVNAKYITLDSVKVENVETAKVGAAIILDEIKDIGFRDGLLGMSFLQRFNFKVDQRDKRLILERLE
jgi:clan AA aspartic protease (TIGR02281 family)